MMLSDKDARKLGKYVVKMVRKQPEWLRKLFDEDKAVVMVEEDGSIALYIDQNLDERVKGNARALIADYMDKHEIGLLEREEVIEN